MLWEIQPPKWHSVCGRCTGFTELSENDEVSFPDCCCLYRCFFLFVGSSVDASILQGVARSGHLLQRCGCIIDGGFFRLMLQGQENKNIYIFVYRMYNRYSDINSKQYLKQALVYS